MSTGRLGGSVAHHEGLNDTGLDRAAAAVRAAVTDSVENYCFEMTPAPRALVEAVYIAKYLRTDSTEAAATAHAVLVETVRKNLDTVGVEEPARLELINALAEFLLLARGY